MCLSIRPFRETSYYSGSGVVPIIQCTQSRFCCDIVLEKNASFNEQGYWHSQPISPHNADPGNIGIEQKPQGGYRSGEHDQDLTNHCRQTFVTGNAGCGMKINKARIGRPLTTYLSDLSAERGKRPILPGQEHRFQNHQIYTDLSTRTEGKYASHSEAQWS